ncbi:hypothetical protein M885DRAFT_23227 [Pelagophyceae sp. CCMP2097]|nr:hypothetical protein M885DRAFT_23227 [Pelagophyceae sp. CCMP2097]
MHAGSRSSRQTCDSRQRAFPVIADSRARGFTANVRYNRGLVHHMEGRSVAAIYDFHKAVEQAKSTDDEQKAWTYSGQEFWLYGRNALDRAADVDVSSLRALRASLYETANMHLDRGHAMMPLTFWARASVAFDLEDFAATVENAQHALTLATNGLGQGGLRLAPAYNILGLALRKLGDDVLAAEAFREGLSVTTPRHARDLDSLKDGGDAERHIQRLRRKSMVADNGGKGVTG